jgi:putative glutamine amidotransferase
MVKSLKKPIIGVPACLQVKNSLPFHSVGDKYLRAITEAVGGIPFIIPAFGFGDDLSELLDHLDGLMITGAASNVHPPEYGQDPHDAAEPYDRDRDATTLPLIRATLDEGLPLFAICRGMQELNVALGGTLQANVQDLAGRMDHRRAQHEDLDIQYGPRHSIDIAKDGVLHEILERDKIEVNSLHTQALNHLAPGIVLEAWADDDTPEAVSVSGSRDFALAVQWHPEYKACKNPVSQKLFGAFANAAKGRMSQRTGTA